MSLSVSSVLAGYGYTRAATAMAAHDTAKAEVGDTSATSAAPAGDGPLTQAVKKVIADIKGTAVTISPQAQAAAAARADNDKDFTALTGEVRAQLDGQYAAGTAKSSPDLSAMTGRALAAVALDKDGRFSAAERMAAKAALQEETRSSFVDSVGFLDAASMASFCQRLTDQYDAMSPEEREARGWTEQFRSSNASFALRSTAQTMPTLFDQLFK